MEINNAVTVLSALAQESRLNIYRLLVPMGQTGLPAGKISELSAIPPSSLSFHLKEMVHANMLVALPSGRMIYYRVNFETMSQLMRFLTDNCCSGESCEVSPQ